jgi:hypothetical protein
MPDPKLKVAMAEVKEVLAKYDIGAIVLLASPTHSEYLYEFSPTWSCAKIEGAQLRVKALRADFPSEEAQVKCLKETIGMLAGFADLSAQSLEALTRVLKMLGEHLNIAHQSKHE